MTQPIWNTAAGSIGSYPCLTALSFQFSASAISPATVISYSLISGTLPEGLSLNSTGLLSGTPSLVPNSSSFTFVIRATDDLSNIRDRTFSMTTSGISSPAFTTPTGTILTTLDSTWIELAIQYSNPIPTNEVSIRVIQGALPPGVEINSYGLIRGYAQPPTVDLNLGLVTTAAVATSSNTIICTSTTGFSVGRPINFTGTTFGGITTGQTYYINSVIDAITFTISSTVGGPTYALSDAVGNMTITLPDVSYGQPTVQTYSFTLKLESLLGNDIQSYYITVANQNAPQSQGGPGYPTNTRIPTIYNTRPPTYNIASDELNYGYYILPPDSTGNTYLPSQSAILPQINSNDFFSFKVLGNDFDGSPLVYTFANLPLGLVGDPTTGWITGTPVISENNISQFSFSVSVSKAINPTIFTPFFNFSFVVTNNIIGEIDWITDSDLGQIYNGTVSTSKVEATSDVLLLYRITSGSLPPNLILLPNGEISGVVAYQPTSALLGIDVSTTFTFTIQAYSSQFSVVQSSKTFTMTVYQEYLQPTDTLYIKCVPNIKDRDLLKSLLTDTSLIPDSYLYRSNDPYFGKSSSVIYEHAYGIYSSNFDQYVAAITKNHYWRNITLGEIKTAVAKDVNGNIIYEVVYSQIIDNLVNPTGLDLPLSIDWPRDIPLNLGPWYDSETNIYTSYNLPDYYTSLDPGKAKTLYPNGLQDMRERVSQELGQEYNSKLLPLWMTSQQSDGSTLGYTPAWVICYTLPGYSAQIQNNIQTKWINTVTGTKYTLNSINFTIDRFTVSKDVTYNYDSNVSPTTWTGLPSASPTPNPLDSKDFSVLFPRKTILPNQSQ
jgi:Putative Ig domain